jgi:hypothetical protein
MRINFVGSFTTGYVGERSDECHLADEMQALGHVVRRLPREEWREYVLTGSNPSIPSDLGADANVIAKWDGFYDGSFARTLKTRSEAPVFYWVWDYMQGEDWHMEMVKASDLYLANDVFSGQYKGLQNCYYFPFDVSDKQFGKLGEEKVRDVAFFGSWIPQGHRQEWLKEINKEIPITVFSWNYQEWPKEFDAHPAVYGNEFSKEVNKTKICLGFSVNPSTWGYWSNRTGKTLTVGGFLLQEYAPGMELFFQDGIAYFSSPKEAIEKINYYLTNETERMNVSQAGYRIGRERFTSKARIGDLMILIERYIKKGSTWNL